MKLYRTAFGELEITNNVLATLQKHRQTRRFAPESGGQLFARFEHGRTVITHATEPSQNARRGRFFFQPSRRDEQREINELFAQGLHYVGDWHSHPETQPRPSGPDLAKMRAIFQHSQHELSFMVMLIVGNTSNDSDMWCGCISDESIELGQALEHPETIHQASDDNLSDSRTNVARR